LFIEGEGTECLIVIYCERRYMTHRIINCIKKNHVYSIASWLLLLNYLLFFLLCGHFRIYVNLMHLKRRRKYFCYLPWNDVMLILGRYIDDNIIEWAINEGHTLKILTQSNSDSWICEPSSCLCLKLEQCIRK